MSETQIKIGAGNMWAGDRRPTAPLNPPVAQPTPVATPVQEAPQDVKPRSFQEIMAERGATPTGTPVAQPQAKKSVWVYVAVFGTMALVLIGVAVILMSMPTPAQKAQPISASTTSAPEATPKPSDSSVPLSERFPASVKPFASDEIVASKNGASLVKKGDGYSIQAEDAEKCIPNFWSPPLAWDQGEFEKKFDSESAPCTDNKDMSVVGYWRDTNWVFWAHPKKDGADTKKKDDWDFLWTEVSWHGIGIEDIKKLDGVKDMYQAPPAAPKVPDAPQVQAPQQPVHVPPAPPPTPSCTTEADIRFTSKVAVSNEKGFPIGEVVGTSCYSQVEADANAQAKADAMKSSK